MGQGVRYLEYCGSLLILLGAWLVIRATSVGNGVVALCVQTMMFSSTRSTPSSCLIVSSCESVTLTNHQESWLLRLLNESIVLVILLRLASVFAIALVSELCFGKIIYAVWESDLLFKSDLLARSLSATVFSSTKPTPSSFLIV